MTIIFLSPPEQAVLQRAHARADADADHRQQEDDAEHPIGLEACGEHRQRLAEAVFGGEDLRADHAEQGEDEAKPQAVEDHRHGARQHELAENLAFAGAERAGERDVIGIDAAPAGHGAGQHDEEGEAETDSDLRAEAQTEPDDEQRGQRDARHRVQRREDRVEHRFRRWARDEQHADQHACDTAEHEGDHGAAHRPVEVVQQTLGDEHLLPKILHDAGRLADQDRVDQFRVGRPLPEDEEHGKKHQPRRPDLSRSPHAFVGHWLNPSSSLVQTCE